MSHLLHTDEELTDAVRAGRVDREDRDGVAVFGDREVEPGVGQAQPLRANRAAIFSAYFSDTVRILSSGLVIIRSEGATLPATAEAVSTFSAARGSACSSSS